MNHEKNDQSFLRNLKSKIKEHFKNKTLKTHYFKDFSRTTYNSRTIQGIQGIQELLATLKHCQSEKQPLRGGGYSKFWGKGRSLYWGT